MFREARYKWKNMMVVLWPFSTNNNTPNNY
jgi:hypothetical protein